MDAVDAAAESDAFTATDAPPDTSGNRVTIPDLDAPVTVLTDTHGIAHLRCRTDADCFAALGYVHASRAFFAMDVARRFARGRLGTLLGEYGVESDRDVRLYQATPSGEPLESEMWGRLSPEARGLLERYSAGVNSWLADLHAGRNGARPPAEYGYRVPGTGLLEEDAIERIPEWEPEDSLAIMVSMQRGNGDNAIEPSLAVPVTRLDPAVFADLFLPLRGSDSDILDAGDATRILRYSSARVRSSSFEATRLAVLRSPVDVEAIERFGQTVTVDLDGPSLAGAFGSNQWAVAASRTGTGGSIYAGDPHGALNNQHQTTFVELDSVTSGTGTLHAFGGTVVGLPIVLLGHGRGVGFSCTVSFADATDYYLEVLSPDGRAVRFRDAEVPIVERSVTLEVAAGEPTTETLRWVPHHGPIVWEDRALSRAISVRWVGHEATTDFDGYLALARAHDVDEAMRAIEGIEAVGCNLAVADREGRVAWGVGTKLPRRPWASPAVAPWLILPGDGSAEWEGWLPTSDAPLLIDPVAGFVSTANNPFDDAWRDGDPTNDDHPYWETNVISSARHARVSEELAATSDHDEAASIALQANTKVVSARVIVEGLLAAADSQPERLTTNALLLLSALREWTLHTCPTGLTGTSPTGPADPDPLATSESIGCTAFHAALVAAGESMILDELEAHSLGDRYHVYLAERVLYEAIARPEALASGTALWDDVRTSDVRESREDVLVHALLVAADDLTRRFGEDPDQWRWGRVHTLTLSPLFPMPGGELGPFANDGGLTTVDPGGGAFRVGAPFEQRSGAVARIVLSLTPDRIDRWIQYPGGFDAHRDSRFHENLLDEYLRNEPVAVPTTADEVDAAAVERLTISAAGP